MLAVFDLDGTLLDGDSTALWLWDRARRSVPRLLATLLVAPIAVPMVIAPRTRRAGASILLWIATVGLGEQELRESCTEFAARFQAGALPLRWRGQGVAHPGRPLRRRRRGGGGHRRADAPGPGPDRAPGSADRRAGHLAQAPGRRLGRRHPLPSPAQVPGAGRGRSRPALGLCLHRQPGRPAVAARGRRADDRRLRQGRQRRLGRARLPNGRAMAW
jgi:phosphatidylglycerophosphatase C